MSHSIHVVDIGSVGHLLQLEHALEVAGVPTKRDEKLTTLEFSLNEVEVVQFHITEEEW